jgi:hypothetical protein
MKKRVSRVVLFLVVLLGAAYLDGLSRAQLVEWLNARYQAEATKQG